MGCCKFIFVYTTRTIITVSPEINIIFKKDASRVIFPNDTLKRYTPFLSGFSQDLFLFLKGVSFFRCATGEHPCNNYKKAVSSTHSPVWKF